MPLRLLTTTCLGGLRSPWPGRAYPPEDEGTRVGVEGSSFYTLSPFPVRKNHTQRSFTGRPKTSRAAVAYNSS